MTDTVPTERAGNGAVCPRCGQSFGPFGWSVAGMHPACAKAWTCTRCTHINPSARTHCQSCGRRREPMPP